MQVPSLLGRHVVQGFPAFTQAHPLQEPVLLYLQHGIRILLGPVRLVCHSFFDPWLIKEQNEPFDEEYLLTPETIALQNNSQSQSSARLSSVARARRTCIIANWRENSKRRPSY